MKLPVAPLDFDTSLHKFAASEAGKRVYERFADRADVPDRNPVDAMNRDIEVQGLLATRMIGAGRKHGVVASSLFTRLRSPAFGMDRSEAAGIALIAEAYPHFVGALRDSDMFDDTTIASMSAEYVDRCISDHKLTGQLETIVRRQFVEPGLTIARSVAS